VSTKRTLYYLKQTMTETQKWYQRYLQTDHWRELRLTKLEEVGHKCEKCRKKSRLQVHHLKYTPYKERLADLQVLCEACHEEAHGLENEAKFEKREIPAPPPPVQVRDHKSPMRLLYELHHLFTTFQFDGQEQLFAHLKRVPRKKLTAFMNKNAETAFAKEIWTFLHGRGSKHR
jgi:5-methylcytosine-specific restriction endonuclease McrA